MQVSDTRQIGRSTLGKDGLYGGPALPSAALGKLPLCRVPVFRHSAKRRALGKERVSHSEHSKILTPKLEEKYDYMGTKF